MSNILTKIITQKTVELNAKKTYYQQLEQDFLEGKISLPAFSSKNFLSAIKSSNPNEIKLIAEIKKASPSKGEIFSQADISKIAQIYEKNGASAISVLSDKHFFQGCIEEVANISQKTRLPVIRKDFMLEKGQILEARVAGASAVLLMVSVLKTAEKVQALRAYAESLDLHCLIETHTAEEIEIAVQAGAKIIGVNSRDFTDLSVDLDRLPSLLSQIPPNIVRVAESGIYSTKDIEKLKPFCDAILVGTSFMKTKNYEEMAKLVKIFSGK